MSVRSVAVPNLDPNFFTSASGSTVSTEDIERQPYVYHWITYACAQAVVRNLKRLYHELENTETDERNDQHPVIKLLNHPNPFMTRTQFWEHVLLCTLLPARNTGAVGREQKGGQCFILPEGRMPGEHVDLAKGEIPASLWPYSEDYFEAARGRNKQFIGWKFRPSGSADGELYAPNELIRVASANPYDWLKGVPVTSPAQIALQQDLNAEVWNTRVFSNDAVPAGILSSDQVLTEPVAKEMQARWYQKNSAGNQRRIAVLGAGLKFQQLSFNAKDMEFVKQKDAIRKAFLAVWGLNEIALGNYEQINYATIVEGRRMLWEDTYLPLELSTCEQITAQWVRYVDAPRIEWELVPDLSKVPALKRARDTASQVAQRFYQMGAPFRLACELAEVELPQGVTEEYPWLDERPQQAASPFGGSAEPTEPDDEDEGDEADEGEGEEDKRTRKGKDRAVRITRDKLDAFSLAYIERVLDPGERFLLNKLETYFHGQAVEMLDRVDEWAKAHGEKSLTAILRALPPVNPASFLPDAAAEDNKLARLYRTFAGDALRRERAKLVEELGSAGVTWNVKDPMIDQYVRLRRRELKEVNRLTFKKVEDRVAEAVKEAVENNDTVGTLARAIKEHIRDVEQIRKNQSKVIARTEVGIISSDARYNAFMAADVEYQQWVNSADERVRLNHQDEPTGDGGSIVRVGNRFTHTGLLHPLDSAGDPAEIINCRCVAIAVANEEGSEYEP